MHRGVTFPLKNSGGTVANQTRKLKPWKPGQSGNPGGRPRRDAISAALRQQLAIQASDDRSVADVVAAALIKRALRGDVRAIREVADRTEGRPRQQLEIETRATVDHEPQLDLDRLTIEQLAQLEQLLQSATRQ